MVDECEALYGIILFHSQSRMAIGHIAADGDVVGLTVLLPLHTKKQQ